MIEWVIGGALVAVVGGFVATRVSKYRRLFADAHVREVVAAIPKLKAAALAGAAGGATRSEPQSIDDPRLLRTSAGLAVVYTIREHDGKYVHHCSVSVAGGVTAHAVGRTFVVLVAKAVGLPIERMAFEVTHTTVHHGELVLDATEHASVASAPIVMVEMKEAMDAPVEFQRLGPSP